MGYQRWFNHPNTGGVSVPDTGWSRECDLRVESIADKCLDAAKGYPFGLLIGDSHAWAAFPVFDRIAKDRGKRLGMMTFPGCGPFLDAVRFGDTQPSLCQGYRATAEAILKKQKLDFAILDAQWIFHDVHLLPVRNGSILKGQIETFQDAVRYDIQALQAAGAGRIAILGPIPVFRQDIPGCVLRADRFGAERERCSGTREGYEERTKNILADLQVVASEFDGVVLIDPANVFCDEQWCRPYDGNSLLYRDFDHLSDAGVMRLYSQRQQAFDWVIGSDEKTGSSR